MVSCAAHVFYVRMRRIILAQEKFMNTCFTSGFMPNYICWTKHEERGVIMKEDEEEEGDDDNMIICGFAEYGAFDNTAMGEAEEKVARSVESVSECNPIPSKY